MTCGRPLWVNPNVQKHNTRIRQFMEHQVNFCTDVDGAKTGELTL